ncbi:uncharacterized protein LOC101862132 [Aplysia californica]|uniref:Uncharacterized protein LOC101862132 n=1 Tax=Aplysia californica TaxID=6500 RepID=A0ABM0JZ76_APLCA|nr:uncharacterized protein LOC101862132 [Aplysia californica]
MNEGAEDFPDSRGKESVLVNRKVKNLPVTSFMILNNTLKNRKIVRDQDVAVPQQWRWKWLHERVSLEGTPHLYGDAFVKVDQPGFVLCRWCVAGINYSHRGRTALADHVKSNKHMEELAVRTDITGRVKSERDLPDLEDRVVEMEAMIRSVIAEHNLPSSVGPLFVDLARQCCRDPEALAKVDLGHAHHCYKVVVDVEGKISPQTLLSLHSKTLSINITELSDLKITVCLDNDFSNDVQGNAAKSIINDGSSTVKDKTHGSNQDSSREKNNGDKSSVKNADEEDWCFAVIVNSVSGNDAKTLDIFHLADIQARSIDSKMMFEALCEVYSHYEMSWANVLSVMWESAAVEDSQRVDLLKMIRENKCPHVKDGAYAKNTMALNLEKQKLAENRHSAKSIWNGEVVQWSSPVSVPNQQRAVHNAALPGMTSASLNGCQSLAQKSLQLLDSQGAVATNSSRPPSDVPKLVIDFQGAQFQRNLSQQQHHVSQQAILQNYPCSGPMVVHISSTSSSALNDGGMSCQASAQGIQAGTAGNLTTFSGNYTQQQSTQMNMVASSTCPTSHSQHYSILGQDPLEDLASVAQEHDCTSLGIQTAAQGLQALSQGFHGVGSSSYAIRGYQQQQQPLSHDPQGPPYQQMPHSQ